MHEPSQVSKKLAAAIQEYDPEGVLVARAMRDSFDIAYNGQHTGHYRLDQLSKTEKAHIGSLLELNLRRSLDGFINDGIFMDFKILGYEVDCKYSMRPGGWMIPTETVGYHAMLCHADDHESTWQLGFIEITPEVLGSGQNRDRKRTISATGRSAIAWAWRDQPLPPNALLQLPPEKVDIILQPKSGQQRLNLLFEIAQERIIPRGTVATVAQQKDYMKRIRENGGSRSALQDKGIIILGDYNSHRKIAADLGLPIPREGESISVRVAPSELGDSRRSAVIEGRHWRIAEAGDPVIKAPNTRTKSDKSR